MVVEDPPAAGGDPPGRGGAGRLSPIFGFAGSAGLLPGSFAAPGGWLPDWGAGLDVESDMRRSLHDARSWACGDGAPSETGSHRAPSTLIH